MTFGLKIARLILTQNESYFFVKKSKNIVIDPREHGSEGQSLYKIGIKPSGETVIMKYSLIQSFAKGLESVWNITEKSYRYD